MAEQAKIDSLKKVAEVDCETLWPLKGAGCRWSRTRDADNGGENREADGWFLSAGNGWIEALIGSKMLGSNAVTWFSGDGGK